VRWRGWWKKKVSIGLSSKLRKSQWSRKKAKYNKFGLKNAKLATVTM